MISFRIARRSRRFRFNAGLSYAILVLFVAYILALTQLQRSTEATYADLRKSDPNRYLSEIRQAEGFRVYLREFRDLKGYAAPQRLAPPFLIGRWAMVDQPLRADDSYVPSSCLDDVIIEDGHIRSGGEHPTDYDVNYVINGAGILALRPKGAPIIITPVGYGVHVNHIELIMPGSSMPRYGYLCK
jgi:hypothetical protein